MDREVEITDLALRFRGGERQVLGELHSRLEASIRGFLGRYTSNPRYLPAGIEIQDLFQQAYVALAECAMEWQPQRSGNFIPYFLRSFPWRIDRYLRAQTPSRRTTRFQLRSVPHDELIEGLSAATNLDGRDWDGALAFSEMMHSLPEQYARVVKLRLFHGLSFEEIGSAVGTSRSTAHEAFGRALSLLRTAVAEDERAYSDVRRVKAPAEGRDGIDAVSLRRCVEVLHQLAPDGSPLPSREVVCRAAGLTWREYRGIMARLRSSGCLVGRRRGSPGALACATAEETMFRSTHHSGLKPWM